MSNVPQCPPKCPCPCPSFSPRNSPVDIDMDMVDMGMGNMELSRDGH